MSKRDWLLIGCTAAIVLTLIGCTEWLRHAIGSDLSYVMRDLELLQR